uniref:BTB domain-containing protein n=1 Tax=Strigamia maritima TaxID=126957 RepID=T1IQF6_STRMM
MMNAPAYSVKWKTHSNVMASYFDGFVRRKEYVDITISCSRASLKAHKLILAASSPYFKQLIDENPSQNPTIVFNDIEYQDMQLILDFIYTGQMNVPVERMSHVCTASQYLQIRGLCEMTGNNHYFVQIQQQNPDANLEAQTQPGDLDVIQVSASFKSEKLPAADDLDSENLPQNDASNFENLPQNDASNFENLPQNDESCFENNMRRNEATKQINEIKKTIVQYHNPNRFNYITENNDCSNKPLTEIEDPPNTTEEKRTTSKRKLAVTHRPPKKTTNRAKKSKQTNGHPHAKTRRRPRGRPPKNTTNQEAKKKKEDFMIVLFENSLYSTCTQKSVSEHSEIVTLIAHPRHDAGDGRKRAMVKNKSVEDVFTLSAKLPIESLSLPMFKYLLFCEKSIIWARFLNDLPLKEPEYRATQSLPHLCEKSTKWDTTSMSWKERKLKFVKRARIEHRFSTKPIFRESYDPLFPYNVEALLVDSTSIEEATNAYHNFSKRILDKISSSSKVSSKEKRNHVKIRRLTGDVVVVFLYFIVFLILCRMSIFVFVVALNTKL